MDSDPWHNVRSPECRLAVDPCLFILPSALHLLACSSSLPSFTQCHSMLFTTSHIPCEHRQLWHQLSPSWTDRFTMQRLLRLLLIFSFQVGMKGRPGGHRWTEAGWCQVFPCWLSWTFPGSAFELGYYPFWTACVCLSLTHSWASIHILQLLGTLYSWPPGWPSYGLPDKRETTSLYGRRAGEGKPIPASPFESMPEGTAPVPWAPPSTLMLSKGTKTPKPLHGPAEK